MHNKNEIDYPEESLKIFQAFSLLCSCKIKFLVAENHEKFKFKFKNLISAQGAYSNKYDIQYVE